MRKGLSRTSKRAAWSRSSTKTMIRRAQRSGSRCKSLSRGCRGRTGSAPRSRRRSEWRELATQLGQGGLELLQQFLKRVSGTHPNRASGNELEGAAGEEVLEPSAKSGGEVQELDSLQDGAHHRAGLPALHGNHTLGDESLCHANQRVIGTS